MLLFSESASLRKNLVPTLLAYLLSRLKALGRDKNLPQRRKSVTLLSYKGNAWSCRLPSSRVVLELLDPNQVESCV